MLWASPITRCNACQVLLSWTAHLLALQQHTLTRAVPALLTLHPLPPLHPPALRYADRNVERHVKAGKVVIPPEVQAVIDAAPEVAPAPEVDYRALVAAVQAMTPDQFDDIDLDALLATHAR